MPRVRLDPKFTYYNGSQHLYFYSYGALNTNYNVYDSTSILNAIIAPYFNNIPTGNLHSQRRGNRITVTSLRVKINIHLDPRWIITSVNPVDPNLSISTTNLNNLRTDKFFKFRYMVVEFDEDIQVGLLTLYKWFKRTYCWYAPAAIGTDNPDEPVSVHANILHETTEWVGKFNILTDKCFTLTSKKPQLSLDITVPMNRQYVYEEDDSVGAAPIYPRIFCFILPPLALPVDLDPCTSEQVEYLEKNGAGMSIPYAHIDYFTKLSFVDL